MTRLPLQDCTIVVTRPTGQAGNLIDVLENAGATVVHFPVIEITAMPEQERLLEQTKQLGTYDIVIFISRNAAIYGIDLLQQQGSWPKNTQIAAIGNGTALQLRALGIDTNIISSTTANSEGLLSEPEMNAVKGKRILIVRGHGGRKKLAETLRSRGAQIDYFECYERSRPQIEADILSRLWDKNSLHGIILTSAEGLKNLYQMVNKNDLPRLNTTPLYVISSTMVELCGKLGYKLTPVLMPSAHDEDVLESVTAQCAVSAT